MNQEELLYAQKICEVEQRLCEISKDVESIDNSMPMSPEKIRKNNLGYMIAVNNYKKCRSELAKIIPPGIVQQEHTDLIETIQMYIAGTELMYKGVCLCSFTINEALIKEGALFEEQGKLHSAWLAEAIANKLPG